MKQDELKKLIELARINVSPKKLEELKEDLGSILKYVSQIHEVENSNDEVTVTLSKNVMRDDGSPHESGIFSKELVDAFPQSEGEYMKVKKIL